METAEQTLPALTTPRLMCRLSDEHRMAKAKRALRRKQRKGDHDEEQ